MRIISLLLTLIILLFGISFAVLNADIVSINYYFGTSHLALSLLIAIALIIGVFLGLIVSLVLFIKAKAKQHHLTKQLHKAQKEIDELRKARIGTR
jgi:putative membrane protein